MITYTFRNLLHEPTILCLVGDPINVHAYLRTEGEKKFSDLGYTTRVIIDGYKEKEFEGLGVDVLESGGKVTKAFLLSRGEGDKKEIGWYNEDLALEVCGRRLDITIVKTPHSAQKNQKKKRKRFYPEPPPDMTPGELEMSKSKDQKSPSSRAYDILIVAERILDSGKRHIKGDVSLYKGPFESLIHRHPLPGEWWATHHSIVGAVIKAGKGDGLGMILALSALLATIVASGYSPDWTAYRARGFPSWCNHLDWSKIQVFSDDRDVTWAQIEELFSVSRTQLLTDQSSFNFRVMELRQTRRNQATGVQQREMCLPLIPRQDVRLSMTWQPSKCDDCSRLTMLSSCTRSLVAM